MENRTIRKAVLADAKDIYNLKQQLPINLDGDKTSKGGFLLGTSVRQYEAYITGANCMVAEVNGSIVGFGIIIPDAMLRATDIWHRRHNVEWDIDLNYYEQQQLIYFEQLAFLPGYKRLVLKLAYTLLKESYDTGAEALFTTTVKKPITNIAAIPLIQVAGGRHAGTIDEYYEVVGDIVSDIYIIDKASFTACIAKYPLYSFLER